MRKASVYLVALFFLMLAVSPAQSSRKSRRCPVTAPSSCVHAGEGRARACPPGPPPGARSPTRSRVAGGSGVGKAQALRRTGRAELDEHADPVSRSEYILSMNPDSGRGRAEMLAALLKELGDEVPGVDLEAEQPLAHLISHMLSGVTAQIAVKIYGDDLDKLRAIAGEGQAAMNEVQGVTPPIIDPQERVDELHVVLRRDDLARYGVSREYVADFVQTALKGEATRDALRYAVHAKEKLLAHGHGRYGVDREAAKQAVAYLRTKGWVVDEAKIHNELKNGRAALRFRSGRA